MSETKADKCCRVIDALPAEILAEGRRMEPLIKTPNLDLRRLLLARGGELPTHTAPGEITVHCLEGRVAFTADDTTHDLRTGQLIHLAAKVPHSVVGTEPSVVLITRVGG